MARTKKTTKAKSKTKSKRGRGGASHLAKWRKAAKDAGYPKKVGGKMMVSPKKGTADYKKVRAAYDASK